MATPDPNHFNGMQARLERDLINTQDHIENLWTLIEQRDVIHTGTIVGQAATDLSNDYPLDVEEVIAALKVQREQVAEFMKYMRMVAGMTLEFPNRTERREYLRANGL